MIYSIWVYDLLTYDILRAHVDWSNFVQNIGFDKTEKSTYQACPNKNEIRGND